MSGIDGREGYLAGLENEGGDDGVVEAAEIEAENREEEGLEAEQDDHQINEDDTDQDISDAVAAKMIDDMNWRQKLGHNFKKGVKGTLKHIWNNKAKVLALTLIPAGLGIGIAEGLSAAAGADIPRMINYPLAILASYPLTAGLSFLFKEATIVWAGAKDGFSRTATVDKFTPLQKIFGHRRRFSDISDTKAGRNNGLYLGTALAASMALFGSQYLNFAKNITLGLPQTTVQVANAAERALWPNDAEVVYPDGYQGEEVDAFTQNPLPEGTELRLEFAPVVDPSTVPETAAPVETPDQAPENADAETFETSDLPDTELPVVPPEQIPAQPAPRTVPAPG